MSSRYAAQPARERCACAHARAFVDAPVRANAGVQNEMSGRYV